MFGGLTDEPLSLVAEGLELGLGVEPEHFLLGVDDVVLGVELGGPGVASRCQVVSGCGLVSEPGLGDAGSG